MIDQKVKDIPTKLKKRNLIVNEDKTERYTIKRNGPEEWKHCKYLGSHLDTEKDIARRKKLANAALNKLRPVFKSNTVSTEVKCRLFEAYISSIFLYNCEIWTLNKELEKEIDVFQRRLLRQILKVYYPRIITNKYLYEKTKLQPWSTTARFKRLKWLGHVFRLPRDSPAPTALREALVKVKKPKGGQISTWISIVQKQLIELNVPDFEIAETIAQNRNLWSSLIGRTMSSYE